LLIASACGMRLAAQGHRYSNEATERMDVVITLTRAAP
jgi:hypothetical protein